MRHPLIRFLSMVPEEWGYISPDNSVHILNMLKFEFPEEKDIAPVLEELIDFLIEEGTILYDSNTNKIKLNIDLNSFHDETGQLLEE